MPAVVVGVFAVAAHVLRISLRITLTTGDCDFYLLFGVGSRKPSESLGLPSSSYYDPQRYVHLFAVNRHA